MMPTPRDTHVSPNGPNGPAGRAAHDGQRGMVSVEAALLVVLLLVPMLLLTMDAGRFIVARHSLTQAVRQGAMVLVHAQSSQADAQATTAVKDALNASGYLPGEVTVTITRPTPTSATITVTLDTTRGAIFGAAFTVLPLVIRESATATTG